MKRRVGFFTNALCIGGTTVSTLDYARYNIEILGNESIIFYQRDHKLNSKEFVRLVRSEIPTVGIEIFEVIDYYLKKLSINDLYMIKAGTYDGQISQCARNLVHCVFSAYEPHGDVYAVVSPYLKLRNRDDYPVVPHIVEVPYTKTHLRKQLGIPTQAICLGCYGGSKSFNIPYVQDMVYKMARKNPTIYFLFANIERFCPTLPNIIHIGLIVNRYIKSQFIQTCDGMLHVNALGETFGMAIGEFSSHNKPVLTAPVGENQAHIELLGDKAVIYRSAEDLETVISQFRDISLSRSDWNAYENYSPSSVMERFKSVFLGNQEVLY